MVATSVKERPILFSAPMVQAILAGEKTQTRRIVKVQDEADDIESLTSIDGMDESGSWTVVSVAQPRYSLRCPYGLVGDRLWVRETFRITGHGPYRGRDRDAVWYRADRSARCIYVDNGEPAPGSPKPDPTDGESFWTAGQWRPSIFMPRSASRLILEITDIRAQRLHDISEGDAEAEGLWRGRARRNFWWVNATECRFFEPHRNHLDAFADLWSRINGEESWKPNPWVWAVTFKVVDGGQAR